MAVIPKNVTVLVDGDAPKATIADAIAKAQEEGLVGDIGAGNFEGALLTKLCENYVDGGVTLTESDANAHAASIIQEAEARADSIVQDANEQADSIVARAAKPESGGARPEGEGEGEGEGDGGGGEKAATEPAKTGGNPSARTDGKKSGKRWGRK